MCDLLYSAQSRSSSDELPQVQARATFRRSSDNLFQALRSSFSVRLVRFRVMPPIERCHRADVVPLDSLCIHPGKSAWVLYVDATCINYDGNAFDAALIAMIAALKNGTDLFTFNLGWENSSSSPQQSGYQKQPMTKIRGRPHVLAKSKSRYN